MAVKEDFLSRKSALRYVAAKTGTSLESLFAEEMAMRLSDAQRRRLSWAVSEVSRRMSALGGRDAGEE